MKPIDFVLFDGDSEPNQPVYRVAEAMQKDIRIISATSDYKVLSYYYHDGQMVLEIDKVVETMDIKDTFDRWYSTFPPLTPWFPFDQPPVRQGVYMVDQSWPDQLEQPVFSLWDGTNWYPQGSTPDDALRYVCFGPIKSGQYMQSPFRQWRGLRSEA